MIKGSISLKITSESDVVIARQRAASFSEKLGFSKSGSVIVSTIISQVSRILLQLNKPGRVNIYSIQKNMRNGIVISAFSNDQNISKVQTVYDKKQTANLRILPQNLHLDFDRLVSRNIIDDFCIVPVSNKGISIEIVKFL